MVLFPFMVTVENSESLEWLTDIIKSKAGEQRFALRGAPRQSLNYSYFFDQYTYNKAKALIYGTNQDNFQIPIWNDLSFVSYWPMGDHYEPLPDQVNGKIGVYTHGTFGILWESNSKYTIVNTINDNWGYLWDISWGGTDTDYIRANTTQEYFNAVVAPIKAARIINGIKATRNTSDNIDASINVLVKENNDLTDITYHPVYVTPYFQYRGHDVVDDAVIANEINESVNPAVETIDNNTGQQFIDRRYNIPDWSQQLKWELVSREGVYNLKRFFHNKKGRQKSFWVPTQGIDLIMTQNISAVSIVLSVKSIDYTNQYGIRDIGIFLNDGSVFYRRIVSSVLIGTDDDLTMDSALGQAVVIADIKQISFITLLRFDSDRFTFRHTSNRNSKVSAPITEVLTQ